MKTYSLFLNVFEQIDLFLVKGTRSTVKVLVQNSVKAVNKYDTANEVNVCQDVELLFILLVLKGAKIWYFFVIFDGIFSLLSSVVEPHWFQFGSGRPKSMQIRIHTTVPVPGTALKIIIKSVLVL